MAGQQYQEGQHLQGSDGNVYVMRGGVPVLAQQAQSPGIVVKDSDPRRPFEAPLAQADLRSRDLSAKKTALEIQQLQQKMLLDNGGVPSDPKLDGLTGGDYLSHLPSARAATVKALLEGRLAFPSGAGMRSPYWQSLLADAAHADPEFDSVNYQSRQATRKDFTSGKSAQNIKALNTAIGHLGGLYDKIGGTASHDFTPYNALSNSVSSIFGAPGPELYKQTAGALAGELTQVYRQSGGAEADIQRYLTELSPNASLAQKQAAIKNITELLNSRLQAIGDQYTKGMGTTAQPLQILDPLAQQALTKINGEQQSDKPPTIPGAPFAVPGASPPSGPQGGPPVDKTNPFYDPSGGPQGGGLGLAGGQYKTEFDPKVSAQLDGMIRSGFSPDRINAALASVGRQPVDPKAVLAAQEYLRQHPDFKGSFANATNSVPIDNPGLNAFQQSAPGVFADQFSNAATFGNKANLSSIAGSGNADLNRGGMEMAAQGHPGAALAGNLAGGAAAAGGLELGLGSLAARAGIGATPWVARGADALYGGLTGASENPDNPLGGAALGGVAGLGGGMFGRKVIAPVAGKAFRAIGDSKVGQAMVNGIRDFRDLPPAPPSPQPLSGADNALLSAANKAGIPDIQARLAEAQQLGVPMSLADTHPALTSLGGAAVRRSPNADAIAQGAFLPRARGQIDRFGQAIERDLGPVQNIPQLSQDIGKQAREAARPIYDQAYAAPIISTPEIEGLLGTPFGKQALGRAHTIAGNEQVSPASLGFALDKDGNVVVNPVPLNAHANYASARAEYDDAMLALSQGQAKAAGGGGGTNIPQATARVQRAAEALKAAQEHLQGQPNPVNPLPVQGYTTKTLDYVKRGMDDVLEQQRNPITGKLVLDEAGAAQNGVKNRLLSEMDRLNPAYGDARAAYAGPMQSRDALAFGQDAVSMNPDMLGVALAGRSPEHLAQTQLGYRGGLMDQANKVRYSSNPFDATIGTPAAEQRLGVMFPDNPGVSNLLRTRDMENGLARTTNDILGNSKTAQRAIADQTFQGDGLAQTALDLGLSAATGQVPIGTMIRGVGKIGLKDAMKLGLGKRAAAKADALAPSLFNTNPERSSANLAVLMDNSETYRNFVRRYNERIGVPAGMFGAAVGGGWPSRK